MEVLAMLAAAIWWFFKALAVIILIGIALGVVLLVLIVAREVAWVIRLFVFDGPKEHIITDIAAVHYVKSGTVQFMYELDGNGKYTHIEF